MSFLWRVRVCLVQDTDQSPECRDATLCPINYLRKHRILFVNLTTQHPQLSDIDAYKVSGVSHTQ